MYGYGVISNVHMQGHKFPQAAANVVSLTDDHSEIFGIVVLDSTYRNIQLGSHGSLSFTKSFAWNSETDCINLAGPGGRVTSNFFKSNDDCMKAYQDNSVYINNVVWHQNVGRALMFSWGNLNEAEDTDGSVQFINTSIIHDKMCFQQPNQLHSDPYNEALGWQAGMVYFSTLINLQHSPSNHIGTPESPVLIQNLRVESRVGGLLLVSNGYAGLDNKAGWMGKDGCTGNVHMHIDGLDLIRVRSYAAPAVGGGCYLDSSFGNIANANCVCTSDLGCNSAQCAVNITIDNVRESQESGAPSFHDSLKTGDNAVITYNSVAGGSGAATAAAQEEEAGEDEEGTRPRQLPMVRGGATRR